VDALFARVPDNSPFEQGPKSISTGRDQDGRSSFFRRNEWDVLPYLGASPGSRLVKNAAAAISTERTEDRHGEPESGSWRGLPQDADKSLLVEFMTGMLDQWRSRIDGLKMQADLANLDTGRAEVLHDVREAFEAAQAVSDRG
jgi:hypothetical protein